MPENHDTVEEFWSFNDVVAARENASDRSVENFLRVFANFLGVPARSLQPTSSGTAALEILLKGKRDRRPVVMVPALNCIRVQHAIEAANCKVQTYDFQSEPGKFDWDVVFDSVTDQVGVLIVTHLYGVPVDLIKAREFCDTKGILLIEDCAQTLGGFIAGQQVGTWGDAAIFSFSYDKPISLGWGGMALINSPEMFMASGSGTPPSFPVDPSHEYRSLVKFMQSMEIRRSRIAHNTRGAASIFRRAYYKFNRAPAYDQSASIGAVRAELGITSLDRYPEIRSTRNLNAEIFSSKCPLTTWPVEHGVQPAWLKQKVQFSGPKQLHKTSAVLCKHGIRAGNFNWPVLINGDGGQDSPNANRVTNCWMDVPIHQGMTVREIEDMVSIIEELM